MPDHYKDELEGLGGRRGQDAAMADARKEFKGKLAKWVETVVEHYGKITKVWSGESQRNMGHSSTPLRFPSTNASRRTWLS